ncbi:hypothetical protein [Pseudomonas moraviensis]|uniref:Uncharacterized protein n=1 Tax=Pseudomonas moraviensis TaxID=321662 RepID=A0A7Y9VW96_9PSED|nr:hypothetical protein [Pseudomonas moraviensis]NYH09422.1 hypothetical protein [Pseudomonas moraviensis]
MSTKKIVPLWVHLRSGDQISAITSKNKLVEGTILSMDMKNIKVKNKVNLIDSILPVDIKALELAYFDYALHTALFPGCLPGLNKDDPTSHPSIVWTGSAEIVEINPFDPPQPSTVNPYIPPGPDNVPWIWDQHYNPGYVAGSNGQQLQEGYVRSTSKTYALKFGFPAEEVIEESTQTVNVKKYVYRFV